MLRGGRVLSLARRGGRWAVDPAAPTALAVRDGVVAAVGDDESVAPLIGPETRVIELAGRAVVPGIDDMHLHLVSYAMTRFGYLPLGALDSWEALGEPFSAAAVGADGWLRAHGWERERLGRPGTAADVDRALERAGLAGTPAVLFDRTGHELLAGTEALRRAGVDAATADLPGGIVHRDASGAPTGRFSDAATSLVMRALPAVPPETLRSALLAAQRELHALGITSLTEPGMGPGCTSLLDGSMGEAALGVLTGLATEGLLTLRTNVLLLFGGTGGATAAELREGIRSGLAGRPAAAGADPRVLRVAGLKIFADGIFRSQTSWLLEPYGTGSRGDLVVGDAGAGREAELDRMLAVAATAGLQAGVHATGDAATVAAVDGMAAADPAGERGLRPYVIHGDLLPPAILPRMAEAGIGWTCNPVITHVVRELGTRLVGEERQARKQPLRSALDAGVSVTLSSDAPVVSPDWRPSVVYAVTREQLDGSPRPGDPERVTGAEALAMMTALPAELHNAEAWKGRIAAGYAADLVVLGGDWPEDGRIHDLLGLPAELTIAGGRVVHESAA